MRHFLGNALEGIGFVGTLLCLFVGEIDIKMVFLVLLGIWGSLFHLVGILADREEAESKKYCS